MISLIAAIGKNRELGKDGKIPWHIPADLKKFRQITTRHPIVMGRKTFESIGRILPNRTSIVITRDVLKFKNPYPGEVVIVSSLNEALEEAKKFPGSEEVFVIGGGQIFQQAISLAHKLYLTIIDKDFVADTFFPDYSVFKKVVFEKEEESDGYRYKFIDLEK